MAVIAQAAGGAAPTYVRSPAWRFLSSLPVDRRLYPYDIAGSIAHVAMLGTTGVLTASESASLVHGLRQVRAEIESLEFPWREDLEDVHTNIEVRLTELLGPLGAKVHTARSRNDQIALDERLWLREAVHDVQAQILTMQTRLAELAGRHVETVMPGYTHLQRAQPVTLAHHLLAHVWRLSRDFDRLADCFRRSNVSPLGAGALAGTTLPIDPAAVAHLLGFTAAFENSIDAVSDRDYFAEFLFDLALLATHLSSFAEELVLWASAEFAFLRSIAELGSGSSLMPQKRNPDVAEITRAKAARVLGDLVSLLATLKSLPLSYNRDLQEDKAPVFDAAAHVLEAMEALNAALPALEFDAARLADAASDPRMLATDLAESLVARGVPFREAYEAVARAIAAVGGRIDAGSLRAAHPEFGEDLAEILDARASVGRRTTPGGPAPAAVRDQLDAAQDTLGREQYALSKHAELLRLVDSILTEDAQ